MPKPNNTKVCYIYQIEHIPTGMVYIGSSLKFPSLRWAQHINLLRLGKHDSTKFQYMWDSNRKDITQWEFSILVCIDRIMPHELHRLEASYLAAVPTNLRLNMPNKQVRSLDKGMKLLGDYQKAKNI
jgi:hypothetical protein